MNAVLISLGLLILGAVASAVCSRRPALSLRIATVVVLTASVLCLGAAVSALVSPGSTAASTLDWPMPLGQATLALDGLAAWFLMTLAVLTMAVALYSWGYMQSEFAHGGVGAYCSLFCLLVASMVLLITAADTALFLVGWEGMSLTAFLLVGFHYERPEVRRAAWMYIIINHVSTELFLLPMFGMMVARSGQLDFASFHAVKAGWGGGTSCTVVFLLALIGFGTKAGFMPMHIWLPVAHPAAPSPISALLSGMVIKTGIYGLLRVLSWLPTLPDGCALVMLGCGMVSGVLGVLYALAQHDIKRLLAYHSIENIGIIGLGIGMGMLGQNHHQPILVALGYGGALLHVLNHALFKGLLFLSAGAFIHATGTGDIDRLGGLARRMPINAALFLIAAVSICGLPPFNGFVSEWLLYGSMFAGSIRNAGLAAGSPALGLISLALMGGLALACFAKVFGVVFLGEPRDTSIHPHATPGSMRLGMYILAGLCIGIGLLPGLVLPLTRSAVESVAPASPDEWRAAMSGVLTSAARLSLMAGLLLATAGLLLLVRRRFVCAGARPIGASVATWGCAYAVPTARMQYTASSFAWSLVQSFRNVLWPAEEAAAPKGPFPGHTRMASHVVDMAEHDFFAPLLRGLYRLLRRIRTVSWSGHERADAQPAHQSGHTRPLRLLVNSVAGALRRGSVQAHLAFIVITLLIVFCIESFLLPAHAPVAGQTRPPVAATDGVGK